MFIVMDKLVLINEFSNMVNLYHGSYSNILFYFELPLDFFALFMHSKGFELAFIRLEWSLDWFRCSMLERISSMKLRNSCKNDWSSQVFELLQLVFIQTTILALPNSHTITKDNKFDLNCSYSSGFTVTKDDENIKQH